MIYFSAADIPVSAGDKIPAYHKPIHIPAFADMRFKALAYSGTTIVAVGRGNSGTVNYIYYSVGQ
jgi:hypothetical protein